MSESAALRAIVGCLGFAVFVSSCSAAQINVLPVSLNPDVDFVTEPGFTNIRGNMTNQTLFGTGGVVPISLNLLSNTHEVTAANSANADVILYFGEGGTPTSTELAVLSSFLASGKGLFVFGNDAYKFASIFGATGNGYLATTTGVVANVNSPMNRGPFGTLSVGTYVPVAFHAYLTDVGPNGVIGQSTDNNLILGASFTLGAGRGVLFNDEEAFMDRPATFPGIPLLNSTNTVIFDNSLAYVIPSNSSVPEPGTLVLMTLGAFVIYGVKRSAGPPNGR